MSTCVVLVCVPHLFERATWTLSSLLGESGGVHIYAANVAFGTEQGRIDGWVVALVTLLLGLVVLGGACAAVERRLRGSRRLLLLAPVLPALLAAGFAAWAIEREELPPPATSVLSSAVALIVFAVVGAYWFTFVGVRRLGTLEAR